MDERERITKEKNEEKAKIRCAQFLLDIFKEYGAEVLGKNKDSDGNAAQNVKGKEN